ncbi:DUF58 domain-containing protein [Hyalangium gracile]|uniref:DUF58 domain-containing protein n=1 Tax=Hyalangium gracile TaxID=394092 RepID=UPI001CCAD3DE|nr:DUF58 domain-containing protein [Hyalangium gracile]
MARRRRWSFFMPPEEHRFLRYLSDRYRAWLTPLGQAMLWATGAAALMMLWGLPPAIAFFSFCAGMLVAGISAGLPFRPRLTLSRRMPPPVSAGDTLLYRVVVENRGSRPARKVVVEERMLPPELKLAGDPPVLEVLAPGEKAEVTLSLECTTRGAYELPWLQASSFFPSALVKWPRRAPGKERLLVYPRFTPLARFDVPHGRNYQPGGIPIASSVGESTELAGTREWREGDRTRDIHWPSLARTGRLVVKEYQEEYFVRLAMVLDVETRTARDDALFERSLSLAAGIADVLARQEYIIDIFAAGSQVFHFQAGRALAHFEHILEILACLEAEDRLDMTALEAALLPEAGKLSAVVLVMMDWDEARAALIRKLKAHGVAVRVLSVRPDRRPEGLSAEEVVELP